MERVKHLRRDVVAAKHLMQLAHGGVPRVIRGDVINIVIRLLRVRISSWGMCRSGMRVSVRDVRRS